MYFYISAFVYFYIFIAVSYCENVKELPVRYVSLRTIGNPEQYKNQNKPIISHGQFIIKRDIAKTPTLIQSDVKDLPSVKTSNIDDLYKTKEFHDLLKEFKLKIDKSKLPNIRDVMSLLGMTTTNGQEILDAIRDFANTSDGLDLIKSYLDYNVANDRIDDDQEYPPKASKYQGNAEYNANDDSNDDRSWWNKLIKWLGLSQSTKIDSTKKDLEILSSVLPISNSFQNNANYIGNFLKPPPQAKIPINPPFKVFNSHSIRLSNQPYSIGVKTLPTIRLTEHQYNEMMKSVNFNSLQLAKYQTTEKIEDSLNKDQFKASDIKRSFLTQPIRTSYDLPTGSLYKANPDDIDKISKILSEKLDDTEVVSAISDLTAQQNS